MRWGGSVAHHRLSGHYESNRYLKLARLDRAEEAALAAFEKDKIEAVRARYAPKIRVEKRERRKRQDENSGALMGASKVATGILDTANISGTL
jgi:hypothetical protein